MADTATTAADLVKLRLIGDARELQRATKVPANIVPLPGAGQYIVIGAPDEIARLLEIAPATEPEAPSAKQEKLRALADRIDYEKLWKLPLMYRDSLTPEGRDRLDAGVMLRRYADLMAPGRWLVLPPTGNVQFSAGSLDKVTEMAKRDQDRRATPSPAPAAAQPVAQVGAPWTKQPPTEQADYWHWNGDPDHVPMIYHVMWSGTAKKCCLSIGQYDIREAIWCDDFGGWWLKIEQPTIPQGQPSAKGGDVDAVDSEGGHHD